MKGPRLSRSPAAVLVCLTASFSIAGTADSAEDNATYRIFVQPSWIMTSKAGVTPRGDLVFRRYAYRQDLDYLPNLMLFTCQADPKYSNYMTIIVPKDYQIKSMPRDSQNASLAVRLLVDDASTYNLIGDYHNGEIAIDRRPENESAFDAVMDASQLAIGFGTGDIFYFYLPPNMDGFLKEASVAAGLWGDEVGDVTFVNRETAYKLCATFQNKK